MVNTSSETQTPAENTDTPDSGEAPETIAANTRSSAVKSAREPGLFSGCLILLRSIFTMPLRTARLAGDELRKIAKAGALHTDKDFPHLFWCKAMLPVIATFLSVAAFLGALGSATAMGGLAGFFAGLLAAVLAAVVTDWAVMIFGEFLMVKVVSVQYYKQHIKETETEIGRD